jgi:hypothetical protein
VNLSSDNPAQLNGVALDKEHPLKDNDRFTISDRTFIYRARSLPIRNFGQEHRGCEEAIPEDVVVSTDIKFALHEPDTCFLLDDTGPFAGAAARTTESVAGAAARTTESVAGAAARTTESVASAAAFKTESVASAVAFKTESGVLPLHKAMDEGDGVTSSLTQPPIGKGEFWAPHTSYTELLEERAANKPGEQIASNHQPSPATTLLPPPGSAAAAQVESARAIPVSVTTTPPSSSAASSSAVHQPTTRPAYAVGNLLFGSGAPATNNHPTHVPEHVPVRRLSTNGKVFITPDDDSDDD